MSTDPEGRPKCHPKKEKKDLYSFLVIKNLGLELGLERYRYVSSIVWVYYPDPDLMEFSCVSGPSKTKIGGPQKIFFFLSIFKICGPLTDNHQLQP